MESLTSPKITVGLHCLRIRTKSMYVTAVVDPAESTFYDPYEAVGLLVRGHPERLRPRWPAGSPGCLPRRNEGVASSSHDRG